MKSSILSAAGQWFDAWGRPLDEHICHLVKIIKSNLSPQVNTKNKSFDLQLPAKSMERKNNAVAVNQTDPAPEKESVPLSPFVYAGFWKRIAACILDILFLCLVLLGILVLLILFQILITGNDPAKMQSSSPLMTTLWIISMLIIPVLYFSFLEYSENQATLGKMALHIGVTNSHGSRISLMHAFARTLLKLFSALIVIGVIIIGFTQKKQGLHDIIMKNVRCKFILDGMGKKISRISLRIFKNSTFIPGSKLIRYFFKEYHVTYQNYLIH